MTTDSRVADLAVTQCGAISLDQLHELGVTRAQLRTRAARDQWRRAAPGVYTVAGAAATWRQRLWIAQLHAGAESTISHQAAASLHRCAAIEPAVALIVPQRIGRLSSDFTWHRLDDLSSRDVVEVDGLRVTSPARTMIDLSSVVLPARLRELLRQAQIDGLVTLAEVGSVLARTRRRGKPGVAQLERALDDLGPGATISRSRLEALLDQMIELSGLPTPLAEHPLPSNGLVTGLVDRYFPEAMLIVEGDGRKWHTRRADFARDRERDNSAAEAGVLTSRFAWEHLIHDVDGTARQLRRIHDARIGQLQRSQ